MCKILAVASLAVVAAALRHYLAVRPAIADVPADLRSPLLPLLARDLGTKSIRPTRAVYRLRTRPGPGVTVEEHRIPGEPPVRVLVTTPSAPSPGGAKRPGVLHLHGGGMVVGAPQFEVPLGAGVARVVGAVMVAPEYRLAPENPFPAALDDCMAALRWMRSNADELGIDPDRIAVYGASAGGGLAAAVAQRAFDERIPLRAQVLVYPMLDDRSALRDDHGRRGRLMWTPAGNLFGWTAYLGRAPRMSDAPEYAAAGRREDLAGLAPAWIGVGDLDCLYDEDVAYAERLKSCGVECELVTVPGMYHGADGLAPKAASMRQFRHSMLEHLRTHL
jgi:acetyl esterase/lipase